MADIARSRHAMRRRAIATLDTVMRQRAARRHLLQLAEPLILRLLRRGAAHLDRA